MEIVPDGAVDGVAPATTSRGIAWFFTFLGLGIDRGGRVISTFFLARILTDTDFGSFLLVLVTLNTAGLIFANGLQAAGSHFISSALVKGREAFSRHFWSLTIVAAVVAGAIVAASALVDMEWLSEEVFLAPGLGGILRVGAPMAAFLVLSYGAEGIINGLRRFGMVAGAKAVVAPLGAVATVWLGYVFGLRGAVIGLVAGSLLLFVLLAAQAGRAGRHSGLCMAAPSSRLLWSVGRLSLLLSVTTMMVGITIWLGQVILTRNAGLEAVGMFGVGNQLRNLMALVPTTLGAATLPFLSARHAAGDEKGFRAMTTEYSLLLFIVVGPVCILLLGLSPEALGLCYGRAKAAAWPGANLLFWAQLVLLPGLAMTYVIVTLTEPMFGVAVNLFWALIYLALAWWLTPRFGYIGLAAATLIASAAQAPICVAYLVMRRAVNLRAILLSFLVLLACAGCAQALADHAGAAPRRLLSPLLASAALLFVWYRGFDRSARLRVRERFATLMGG